ncbi:HAD family hydrolase [Sulfoacidibacillus thermotolerans]|uniref:Haloacid dehalogenase n=1 Tax=Sulfoacidibacillus thermotolerans TaxID=1765684 RepID=A0A2U3DBM4_SULT2|nr:HAD family hydrolase [Sulfoacidibacillus thermotolerans]PWI58691.1 hypothetical protein BM613_00915 [Sulfoacidibacillus thermotolerans]
MSKKRLLLFDLDGVLLSEEGYLDTAALTIGSFLPLFFPQWSDRMQQSGTLLSQAQTLRSLVFSHALIQAMRRRALNSNWDKAYVGTVLLGTLAVNRQNTVNLANDLLALFESIPGSGQEFLYHIQQMENVLPLQRYAHPLFEEVKMRFQRFYLGDATAKEPSLQMGMVAQERLLCDRSTLYQLFQSLHSKFFTFGIGTGRPRHEALSPLAQHELLTFFDPLRICTSDEVFAYEKALGVAPYSRAKPHPYTYASIAFDFPIEQVYVIGDSPADWLAAHAAGFHFIGIGSKASFHAVAPLEDVKVVQSVAEITSLFV